MTPETDPGFGVQVKAEHPLTWRRTPALAIGSIAALSIAGAGLALSRPDIAALGIPLALWCALVIVRPHGRTIALALGARAAEDAAVVTGAIDVSTDADWAQLAVDQGGLRRGHADATSGQGLVRTRSRLRHSGPAELIGVVGRGVASDGAWVSAPVPRAALE